MVLPSPYPLLLPYRNKFNVTTTNKLLDLLLAHLRRLPNLRLGQPHSDRHTWDGRYTGQRNGWHLYPARNRPRGRYRYNATNQNSASCLRVVGLWCSSCSIGLSESRQDPENRFSCLTHDITNR